MFSVYIIYSEIHDKYYVGQTSDIDARMLYHNEGKKHMYTSKYRPWTLKVTLPVSSRSVAMRLEKFIKQKKKRSYLEALIADPVFRERIIAQLES